MVSHDEAEGLFQMLADLAKDPKLLERFQYEDASRQEIARNYGLSAEQRDLMERAIDDKNDVEERYRLVAKLIGDAAESALIPFV